MTQAAYTAPELVKLRARPQAFPVWLAVHKPAVLLTATVASVPGWPSDGTGAGTLALSSIANSGSPQAGATVRVGTDPRNLLRLRADYSASPISVAATSQAALNISIGDAITIVDDYRPLPKRIRYSGGAWYTDFDVVYSDQNEKLGPMAIMGPCAIDSLSGSAGSTDFAYDASRSYCVDGASVSSYAWTFPSGSASGSSATFTTSTDYAAGKWTKLIVTDSNGKTQTTRRLLWRFSTDNPPAACVLDNITSEWGGGGETVVTVYGASGSAAYPVGAHVALFTAATYSGSAGDVGGNFGSSRANILFEGWITEVRPTSDPYNGWTELTLGTIDKLLAEQVAFPMTLTDTASPTDWIGVKDLTLNKAMVLLAKHFSTLAEVTDVYVTGQQTASIAAAQTDTKKYQDLDKGTLWEQLQSNYAWIYGAVSSDLQSALWCEQDAIIGKFGASLPVMFALANGDIRDKLEITEAQSKPSAQVTVYGVDYDVPIGSRAPDDPPDYAREIGSPEAKHHCTQAQANVLAGGLRAKHNNPYPAITVPLSTGMRLDPAPQCVITWTPASATQRDPAWTAKPLIVRRVKLDLSGAAGSLLATVEVEPNHTESDGVGVTFDVPGGPDDPVVPPPVDLPPTSGSTATAYVTVATDTFIGATSTFTSGSPNWTDKTGAITGTIHDYILDPWSPTTTAYVGASTGIWRTQTLSASVPAWYNVLTASAFLAATGKTLDEVQALRATITQQGRLYCLAIGHVGTDYTAYVGRTSDAGNTWAWTSLGTTTNATDLHGLAASQHAAGTVLASYGAGVLAKSTNAGATFSTAYTVPGAAQPIANIMLPYENNGSDAQVLIGGSGIGAGASGVVIDSITPVFHDYPGTTTASASGLSGQILWTVPTAALRQLPTAFIGEAFFQYATSGTALTSVTVAIAPLGANGHPAVNYNENHDRPAFVRNVGATGFQMGWYWDLSGRCGWNDGGTPFPGITHYHGTSWTITELNGEPVGIGDYILESTDGGSTFADITPAAGGALGKYGLLASTASSAALYALAGASGSTALTASTDSGANWTDQQTGLTGAVAIGGWPFTTAGLYWLTDDAAGIHYSGNSGSSAQDKTGDWGSAIGTFDNPVNIIPDWTR